MFFYFVVFLSMLRHHDIDVDGQQRRFIFNHVSDALSFKWDAGESDANNLK